MHIEFLYHHTTLLILQYIYSDVYSSVLDVVMVVLDYGLCDTMCFSRRTPGLSRNPHSGKEYLPWRTLLYSFGKVSNRLLPSSTLNVYKNGMPSLCSALSLPFIHAILVKQKLPNIYDCLGANMKV